MPLARGSSALPNPIYIYDPPKSLNGTLAVELLFQTLAVDVSLNL